MRLPGRASRCLLAGTWLEHGEILEIGEQRERDLGAHVGNLHLKETVRYSGGVRVKRKEMAKKERMYRSLYPNSSNRLEGPHL